jgi:UDP-GlcNAc3NAcA epimerase
VDNLASEGIRKGVELVGDVMYDAALYYGDKAEARGSIMAEQTLEPYAYVLATLHRAENTDDPIRLRAIIEGLGAVAQHMPVVIPLHPRTRAALEREGLLTRAAGACHLIPPVGYLDMILLEKKARLIATDSGGVQKEAYFYGVPCITLREETEWVETVEAGWNMLVGADRERIASAALSFVTPAARPAFYGDGKASARCVALLAGAFFGVS